MGQKNIILLLSFMLLFTVGILVGQFLLPSSSVNEFVFTSLDKNREESFSFDNDAQIISLQQAFRNVSGSVLPSVIEIHGKGIVKQKFLPFSLPFGFDLGDFEAPSEWAGSGFIFLSDNDYFYALTNHHVVENANFLEVKFYGSDDFFPAEIKGFDAKRDLALIAISTLEVPEGVALAPLGDSDDLQVGDIVLAFGSPLYYSFSVTQGIVSALVRSINPNVASRNYFIQTDAAINQGNSGGPLVNLRGEVIGINTAIASTSGANAGISFAIPINDAKRQIKNMLEGTISIEVAWLGILMGTSISNEEQESLSLKTNRGALVTATIGGSPAEKWGIRAGDFIIAIDDKPISSGADLLSYLNSFYAGESISLTFIREEEEKIKEIELFSRPKEEDLIKRKVTPPFFIYPLTQEIKKYFRIDKSWIEGVIVTQILEKDYPLQKNDIITHIDGKLIKNMKDFYSSLYQKKSYSFSVLRNGKEESVKVSF